LQIICLSRVWFEIQRDTSRMTNVDHASDIIRYIHHLVRPRVLGHITRYTGIPGIAVLWSPALTPAGPKYYLALSPSRGFVSGFASFPMLSIPAGGRGGRAGGRGRGGAAM